MILRPVAPDVRETTEIGRFLGWLAAPRPHLRRLRRAAPLVGDRPRRLLVGRSRTSSASASTPPLRASCRTARMPGTEWFPGATLNYAEHALGHQPDHEVAVIGYSQTRDRTELTWGELRDQVARARAGLARLGVGRGDRVVAYLPNIPETVVAYLAAASLGAIWASCAPEFGARSVVDRFGQVEPRGAADGVRLPLRRQGRRPPRRGRRAPRRPAHRGARRPRPLRRRTTSRTRVAWERAAHRDRRARVRAGRLRPPAVRAVLLRHHRQAEGDRARPRRDPAGAPEEPRPQLGPAPGRPDPVVLHHRLDDVERAGVGAAHRRVDRADRRQPAAPGPGLAVAARRRDPRDADGRQPGIPDGVPEGGPRPGRVVRPVRAPAARRGRQPAARGGLPLGAATVFGPDVLLNVGSGGTDVCSGIVQGSPLQPVVAGEISGPVPGGRREGVRRRRRHGGRRAGRAGHHRADAVHAGRVLG